MVGNENHWDLISLRTGLAAFSLSFTDDWELEPNRDSESRRKKKKEEDAGRYLYVVVVPCVSEEGLTPQGDPGVADNPFQDTR